jgi:hypothetical protein
MDVCNIKPQAKALPVPHGGRAIDILNPFSLSGILKMLFFSLARQIIQA